MIGIFVGSAEIGSIFVGSDEIAEAYLGSTKIFPAGAPSAFAAWDPLGKGPGATLTESNLRASIVGFYMAAATNPQPTGTPPKYCELVRNDALAGFLGIGLSRSDSIKTTSYQGDPANGEGQATIWQDSSNDISGGLDISPNRPDYSGLTGIKLLYTDVGLMIGEIGGGWWSTITEDWTGDPTNNDICIIRTLGASAYSIGITTISAIDVTANFGASAWLDTPPTGAVGWPG